MQTAETGRGRGRQRGRQPASDARALAPTLAFADRLADLGKTVWVRYVLVPGWTDAPEEVDSRSKYDRLGIAFPLDGTPTPMPDEVAAARAVLLRAGSPSPDGHPRDDRRSGNPNAGWGNP